MSLRRRIALFLDRGLTPYYERDEYLIANEIGAGLQNIDQTLRRIESRMSRRRPRVIECKHPELHPDDPDAVAWLAREDVA